MGGYKDIIKIVKSGDLLKLKEKISSIKDFNIEKIYKDRLSSYGGYYKNPNCTKWINGTFYKNMTILAIACEYNQIDIVKFLVEEYDADIHTCRNEGISLLYFNVDHENTEIAKFLIEHGAETEFIDNNGFELTDYLSDEYEEDRVIKKSIKECVYKYIHNTENYNLKPCTKK
jgi:hypothetical protein